MKSAREKRKKSPESLPLATTEVKRSRGRLYKLRNEDIHERRIQSLARLLQGESECVAITVINHQCLIAANEFKKSSRLPNRYSQHIDRVMTYFKTIHQGGSLLSGQSKLTLLKDIFTPQCKKSTKGIISISDRIITLIIAQVVDGSCSDKSLLKLYKNDHASAGLVLGQFEKFYADFCKVEQSVKTDLSEIFSSEYQIIRESVGSDEIHAEAQLLEKILKEKLYETETLLKIELGVSKLCCAHCCELLDSANEVFQRRAILVNIVFAGRHDLDFKKWKPPEFINTGFEAEGSLFSDPQSPARSSQEDYTEVNISYAVGMLAKQRIALVLSQQAPRGVLQVASVSSSEPEQTLEERLRQNQQRLNSMKELLESLPYHEVNDNLELIHIGLSLSNSTAYKSIFEDTLELQNSERIIKKLLSDLNHQYSREKLLTYLSADSFVGSNVAKFFKSFVTTSVWNVHEITRTTSSSSPVIKKNSFTKNQGGNRTQGYTRYEVESDGNCGYTSLGVTREDATKLLLDNIQNIRDLIVIPVKHLLLTESFYRYLLDQETIAVPHENIVNNEQMLEHFSTDLGVQIAYIKYDVQDRRIDTGFSHPAILQALAHIRVIEIHMWRLGEKDVLVPHDTYEKNYSVYTPKNAIDRVDLLFVNGNHFERLDIQGYENNIPTQGIYPLDSELAQKNVESKIESEVVRVNSCTFLYTSSPSAFFKKERSERKKTSRNLQPGNVYELTRATSPSRVPEERDEKSPFDGVISYTFPRKHDN